MQVYAISCKTANTVAELQKILSTLENVEAGSLVCFPEYTLGGPPDYAGQALTSELFAKVSEFAKDKQAYLALGTIELDESKKYVAGLLIGKDGELIGKQRKILPTGTEIKNGISAGEPIRKTFPTEFGTIAFSMCLDHWCLEHSLGAEIIINPRGFGLDDPKYGIFSKKWLMLDQVTAMLSKAYFIGTTGAVGETPLSDIIDFEGDVLAESKNGSIINAKIDLDLLRKYRSGEFISKTIPKFKSQ